MVSMFIQYDQQLIDHDKRLGL